MDEVKPFDTMQKVELAMIRAEYQKHYQNQINYLKEIVGEGIVYQNPAVRIVVSEAGAYYELEDLKEEFGGAAGEHIERQFVTEKDAVELLARAVGVFKGATFDNTRRISAIVLYARRGLADRKNSFIFEYQPDELVPTQVPFEIGKFQEGVLPLFYKVTIDSDLAQEAIGMERGMVFCMSNAGDRNLLVRIPYIGDQVINLNELTPAVTIQ